MPGSPIEQNSPRYIPFTERQGDPPPEVKLNTLSILPTLDILVIVTTSDVSALRLDSVIRYNRAETR